MLSRTARPVARTFVRGGARSRRALRSGLLLAALLLVGCTPTLGTVRADHTPAQRGLASWYGPNFVGRPTANGEVFDPEQLTAAHKSLPFGTRVRVVNLENGRSVVVRINDRGPFKPGRIIDLSRAAARRIGMIGSGVAEVRVEAVDAPGVVPLHAWNALQGYRAISPAHRPGRLLVLRSADGRTELLVRVVSSDPPARAPVGLLVAPEVHAALGGAARVFSE